MKIVLILPQPATPAIPNAEIIEVSEKGKKYVVLVSQGDVSLIC